MTVNSSGLRQFYAASPVEQERRILALLKDPQAIGNYRDKPDSEFFQTGRLGRLAPFDPYRSNAGAIPYLDFPQARQFLLDQLAGAAPGVWYSTADWVSFLKQNHPYFLIPKTFKVGRNERAPRRYESFYEGVREGGRDVSIPDDAPDGFTRVEGRYIERFLENVPLVMRFVDLAYDPSPYHGLYPTCGTLKAFRVRERLGRVLKLAAPVSPRVTVQPNLEVVIESEFYPSGLIAQILALGEVVSQPPNEAVYVGVFRLQKTRVAAERVRQPDLDVVALLAQLSGRPLPSNVQVELEEWSGHADQFVLYSGASLLESTAEIPEARALTREAIAPGLSLVRDPDALFRTLEASGYVPLRVRHTALDWTLVPEGATSVFPHAAPPVEVVKVPRAVTLERSVWAAVKFPDLETFDAFRKALAELRCAFQTDLVNRTLSYPLDQQPKFDQAVQQLAEDFNVK